MLIVDGDPGRTPVESETFFLQAALRLAPAGQRYEKAPFDATAVELSGSSRLPDLGANRAVVLANVADLEEATTSPDLAPYAARDVNLGLAVAEFLLETSLPEEVKEKTALAFNEALPGRFEVCEVDGVLVVLDGGHNAAGVSAALAAVRQAHPGRPFGVVFGVLREKDAAGMLSGFVGEAHAIVLTRPEGERAADPAQVKREHDPTDRKERRALVVPDPMEALGVAVEAVREVGGVVLVMGSLSTVAPVLRGLREA